MEKEEFLKTVPVYGGYYWIEIGGVEKLAFWNRGEFLVIDSGEIRRYDLEDVRVFERVRHHSEWKKKEQGR